MAYAILAPAVLAAYAIVAPAILAHAVLAYAILAVHWHNGSYVPYWQYVQFAVMAVQYIAGSNVL